MTRPRTKTQGNPTIPRTQDALNKKAVQEAYTEASASIGASLEQLRTRLANHRSRFEETMRSGRVNWGLVGDLNHVATLLSEITEFLGKE